MEAAGLNPDGTAAVDPDAVDPNADDEQIIALASVTSLPLRFAEGRDLMAQVGGGSSATASSGWACRSARRSTAATSSTSTAAQPR